MQCVNHVSYYGESYELQHPLLQSVRAFMFGDCTCHAFLVVGDSYSFVELEELNKSIIITLPGIGKLQLNQYAYTFDDPLKPEIRITHKFNNAGEAWDALKRKPCAVSNDAPWRKLKFE